MAGRSSSSRPAVTARWACRPATTSSPSRCQRSPPTSEATPATAATRTNAGLWGRQAPQIKKGPPPWGRGAVGGWGGDCLFLHLPLADRVERVEQHDDVERQVVADH